MYDSIINYGSILNRLKPAHLGLMAVVKFTINSSQVYYPYLCLFNMWWQITSFSK